MTDNRGGDRHKRGPDGKIIRKQTKDYPKRDEFGRRLDRLIAKENREAMATPKAFTPKSQAKTKKPAAAAYMVVDGEALQGVYTYLAAWNGSKITAIEHLPGLHTRQVFDFLLGLPSKELWGFGVSYDINMWLVDLGKEHLERLAQTNHTYWGEYSLSHIPGKFFQVSERGLVKGEYKAIKTVRLWDMWNFADSSFVELVKDWELTEYPEELTWLQEMKEERANFTERTYPAVKTYCNLELRLLYRGVQKFKSLVEDQGWTPRWWHSAGSISAVVMSKREIQKHIGRNKDGSESDVPEPVAILARDSAYYGGRFEVARVGLQAGPLYNYDIHSAYPAAAVDLPSLTGGRWEHREGPGCVDLDDPGLFALVRCQWKPMSKRSKIAANRDDWGPFPWRIGANSSSQYPVASANDCYRWQQYGWYWSCEVAAARYISRITVLEAWIFHPATTDKPFAYLKELYNRRLELKARHDDREHIFKLVLNATYGKLAQRPQSGVQSDEGGEPAEKLPRFYCPVYAGWICAKTRARLLWELARDDVIVLATDGFVSTEPHQVDLVGDGLGQWEMQRLDWMFVIQAGFYFWPGLDKDGKATVVKHSRGIGKSTVDYEQVLSHWKEHGSKPLTFNQRFFVGYKSALGGGDFDNWRRWVEVPKDISLTMEPRRVDMPRQGLVMASKPPLYGDRQRGLLEEIMSTGNEQQAMDYLGWEQPDIPD